MTLFYLPFGKLFHVVQRPASIGVELYQRSESEMPQAACARCGAEFVAQLWLDDLKTVVDNWDSITDGGWKHSPGLLSAMQADHARTRVCEFPRGESDSRLEKLPHE